MKITSKGFISADAVILENLREEYQKNSCIYIPKFIDKEILGSFLTQLDTPYFHENEHLGLVNEVFAKDQTMKLDSILLTHIHFLLNNSDFFKTVELITDCDPIRSFGGRIYQNLPNSEHHLDWHDDLHEKNRLIGFSMNLSTHKYEGGKFQIREKRKEELLKEIPCGTFGDVHIFKVSKSLEHRVTKTEGMYPRIAAAGWFRSDFMNSKKA